MPEFRVEIANCPISDRDKAPHSAVAQNGLHLILDGFRVDIWQTADGAPSARQKIKGKTAHTTTFEFGNVPAVKQKRVQELASDLVWLLSLATMSPVRPLSFQFGRNIRRLSINERTVYYRPSIDTSDGSIVRNYLEKTWGAFRSLKKRRLDRVIDYLVISEREGQPIEVAALLLFTALESLKSTHSPGHRGSFKARVENMLKDVGMRPGLVRLTNVRNQLVHEGLASIPLPRLSNHRDRLHDILREYLMRLLGYSGPYLLYKHMSRVSRSL